MAAPSYGWILKLRRRCNSSKSAGGYTDGRAGEQRPVTASRPYRRNMRGTDGAVSNRVLGEGLCDFADSPPMEPGDWVPDERLLIESRQLADRYKELAWRLNIHFAGTGT